MSRPTRSLAIALLITAAAGCGGTTGPTAGSSASTATAPTTAPTTTAPTATAPTTTAPTTTASAAAAPVQITARGFRFQVPRSVPPGAPLRLVNKDNDLHSFTSAKAGLDVRVPVGKTAEFRAPRKPGTYRVVCSFHADMDTSLVVK